MSVYYSAGAVSSELVMKAEDMGFVGSEVVGFVSDHHEGTERSVKLGQLEKNQSDIDQAEQQLRQLQVVDEMNEEEDRLTLEKGVQGECRISLG